MKILVRTYRWIIISVLLQLILLFYMNNFYLNPDGNVAVTSLEVEDKPLKVTEVNIPEYAENIRASFDGAYTAYIKDGNIQVLNSKTGKISKTILKGNGKLAYYRWLNDRNMIIYSVVPADDSQGYAEVKTYDVDSNVERSYPKINNLPKGSVVDDIELSALTNVVYVKIKTSSTRARIYKFNIMNELSHILTTDLGTLIKQTTYSDVLVYQDINKKLLVWDGVGSSTKVLKFKHEMALLGIDSHDRVYAGELDEENKVVRVHYGEIDNDIKTWDVIESDKPLDPKELIVTYSGEIFYDDRIKNELQFVKDKSYVKYSGTFIEALDGLIITKDGRKLKFSPINKNAK